MKAARSIFGLLLAVACMATAPINLGLSLVCFFFSMSLLFWGEKPRKS